MRSEDILKELEEQYGVEVDANFDLDLLCDGDFCRHAECDCWDNFRREVESHLDNQSHVKKLRGSMSIAELRQGTF